MKKTVLRKYAKLIAVMGINVRKGQEVIINAGLDQPEFVSMLTEECYKAGAGKVTVNFSYQPLEKLKVEYESEKTLGKVDKWEEEKDKTPGFTYVKLPSSMEGLFSISSQGKSATTVLDEFLYNNTYCTESISVTSIPIYYLEPNTRIFIDDENSKICGEYLVSRYSIPLSHNGTMNISATKAVERLY